MEDCLSGAAKLDWIDAVMFTYNFRVMHDPKMKEALNACEKAGIGLVAMKSMGGGPGAKKIASEAKLEMADRFLKRGFTDKQAKLKVVWENPQIASLCSQMPNLTILMANVAAARDQVKLAREEFESLRQYALETQADYCAGCGHLCQAVLRPAMWIFLAAAALAKSWAARATFWPHIQRHAGELDGPAFRAGKIQQLVERDKEAFRVVLGGGDHRPLHVAELPARSSSSR